MSQNHMTKAYPNDDAADMLNVARTQGPELLRDAEELRRIGEHFTRVERQARSGELTPERARADLIDERVKLFTLAQKWLARPES